MEKFELHNLIHLTAELDEEFSSLARDVLEQKLAVKTIVFGTPYMKPSTKNIHVQEMDDFIRIQNFAVASTLLQNFGHFIQSIRIDEYFLDANAKEIYRLVNLHCSETLKKIHLKNSMEDFSYELDKPFNHVKTVHLEGDLRNVADLELNFNKIFPQMRQLILGKLKIYNTDSIEIEFPNLHIFDVEVFEHDIQGRFTEDVVEKMIRKNPQIRHLILKNASLKLLNVVNDELKKIETLQVHEYDD